MTSTVIKPSRGYTVDSKRECTELVWRTMASRLSRVTLATKWTILMPSAKSASGDSEIELLRSLGVPYDRMLFLDASPAVIATRTAQFRGARGISGDVLQAKTWDRILSVTDGDVAMGYLDLTTQVDRLIALTYVPSFLAVVARAEFAVNSMRGREIRDTSMRMYYRDAIGSQQDQQAPELSHRAISSIVLGTAGLYVRSAHSYRSGAVPMCACVASPRADLRGWNRMNLQMRLEALRSFLDFVWEVELFSDDTEITSGARWFTATVSRVSSRREADMAADWLVAHMEVMISIVQKARFAMVAA